MKGLGSLKGRAPGVDGIYAEMLNVVPRVLEFFIVGLWEAFGRLGMFPGLFRIKIVEPLRTHRGSRSNLAHIDR